MGYEIVEGRLQTSSLEAHVVDHCNLSCMHCCTGSPFLTPRFTEPAALASDLARVAKVVRTQILHLSGGEPLLHPALNRCLDAAKASGVAEKIGVVTNGWLLPKAPTGFWRRIDRLTISFFPSLPLPDDILALAYAQCERSNVLLSVKPFAEFQSFEVKAPWDDAGIVDPVV